MAKRKPLPKVREFADLELNGETFKLCWDFGAVDDAERASGLSLINAFVIERLTVGKLAALLYAAMLPAHPDVTLEFVRSLILPEHCFITTKNVIYNGLVAAWEKSFRSPTVPEIKDGDPPAADE